MKCKIFIYPMLTALLLYGCSFAPRYTKPQIELPTEVSPKTEVTVSIPIEWWKNFNDDKINRLIAEALQNNDDLKLAVARIEEAIARLGNSEANRYPTIHAGATALRQKTSKEVLLPGGGITDNDFTLSGSVAYELDLWGKLKNQREASLSALLSTKANKEAIKLTLVSDVATAYFNLVSLGEQIQTTEDVLNRYREIYEFRLKQYKHGVLDEIVVQQSKAEYDSTKILLENLKEQKIILMSALSILLGKTPKEIFENQYSIGENLPKPIVIPAQLPSKLLENRPDIIQAEEALKAANFQIGVARAAYFPSISLTGILGRESVELGNLIHPSAAMWSIGANAAASVLDFGRIKSNVKIMEAQQKEALIQYVMTVKVAFKEVYDALAKIETSGNKLKAQEEEREALGRVLTLANKKYEKGVTDYLTVLDAQRHHLSALINLISLQAEVINNQVILYKALGGGWDKNYLVKNEQ